VEAASVSTEAVAPVTEIVPELAPEPERVQAETRRLLEGESYDRAVVSSRDSMARQMIATELLSALAGRNVERRERARAAFIEQGFFDETARDLRDATAPAERAAAARSLAIFGDQAATPHLVPALADESFVVRRAAVEALGALRDPTAIGPLEVLLEREKDQKNRIPIRVIHNAIESCLVAAAESRAESESAAKVVPSVEPAPDIKEGIPDVTAAAGVAPVDEVTTLEVTALTEAASSVAPDEVTMSEAAEETAVALTPFVEGRVAETATPEEAPAEVTYTPAPTVVEDARADEEVTLVAEAETHVIGEVPVSAADTHAVVLDEPAPEELPAVAEFNRPAPFDDEAAEVTHQIEPVPVGLSDEAAPSGFKVVPGEWFEFDMSELPAETRTPAVEQSAGELPAPAHAVESSTGKAITTPSVAETETEVAEPTPVVAAVKETESAEAESVEVAAHAPVAERQEKGVALFDELSTVPASIQQRLASSEPKERAAAIVELSHVDTDEAFQQICAAFDDEAKEVRSAAARALFELRVDRAESFTRALREATPERRRQIGASISTSGLAGEAISQLTGESREKTYEAFSLLFLMAKAGEVQPLVRAIEGHPNNEVRLAVVKLLALSGQKEILPAFRRLAVRGSLPTEVRSAVMEAIYQISSSQSSAA
jgi:HEAT repeat protein